MKVKLVQIGGSQGFLVPKALLAEMGETKTFDLSLEKGALVLRSQGAVPPRPRVGWAESFVGFGESAAEKKLAADFDF